MSRQEDLAMADSSERDGGAAAEVVEFPRKGFVIRSHHCREPGDLDRSICLLDKEHEGEHVFCRWEEMRVPSPFGDGGTLGFGGFAR